MTILVGILGPTFAVIATDSCATDVVDGQGVMKEERQKLFKVHDNILAAGTGLSDISDKFMEIAGKEVKLLPDIGWTRDDGVVVWNKLREKSSSIHKEARKYWSKDLGVPPPRADLMIAAHAGNRIALAFIEDAQSITHVKVNAAKAMGSGAATAEALLRRYRGPESGDLRLHQAQLLALRAVRETSEVAAWGLGPPYQIGWIIRLPDGSVSSKACNPLNNENMDAKERIKIHLGAWQDDERRLFEGLGKATSDEHEDVPPKDDE